MKAILISALVCFGLRSYGQALPIDSASGKVRYKAEIKVAGASSEQLFRKAKAYAYVATQAPLIEEVTSVVSGAAEQNINGRILRYEVYIKVLPDGYRFELSDFYNKTVGAQYKNAAGVLVTAPGGQAPLEQVLANPDGYKKGKPTTALLAYRQSVVAAIERAAAQVRQGMK
jgi:hypothetical protein